jgi:competence ComEA-like helix-hairpin-helix protein
MKNLASATLKFILVLLSFAALLLSFSCLRRQRDNISSGGIGTDSQSEITSANPTTPRININTAFADELEKLPGLGKAIAARIVEHREKYGAFRRPEHLIMVRGISDRRFRALRDTITVE